MNAVGDTSILVAALSHWHPAHSQANHHLLGISTAITHTLAEAFSSVTRMPPGQRISEIKALNFLVAQFTNEFSLPSYIPALSELLRLGITGGAIYDGLIAIAARNAGLKLLTLDKRASRTYNAVGVEFELLN